ncbi:hypothetical protein [Streptomyces hundungensis]|uniref:hypothetical protein n=1 Tax=Streptomyces hundungensis TaxID=1077946 RepID=UPI0033CABFD2
MAPQDRGEPLAGPPPGLLVDLAEQMPPGARAEQKPGGVLGVAAQIPYARAATTSTPSNPAAESVARAMSGSARENTPGAPGVPKPPMGRRSRSAASAWSHSDRPRLVGTLHHLVMTAWPDASDPGDQARRRVALLVEAHAGDVRETKDS